MTPNKQAALEALKKIKAYEDNRNYNRCPDEALIAAKFAILDLQAALIAKDEWQPIETAPRDGWILGINARGSAPHIPFIMKSKVIDDEEYAGEAGWFERLADWPSYPTHWMPLPTPPEGLKVTK